MRSSTLRLSFPFGKTLLLALMLLPLVIVLAETVLRLPFLQSRLPAPSIGSSDLDFEVRLHLLDQHPVDCLILGSSMAYNDANPDAIEQAYEAGTGEVIECFTIGVAGLTASLAASVAELLVDRYHPRLLIYGIAPRDFSPVMAKMSQARIELIQLPWFRYRLGSSNVEGWLFDHSYLYRYGLVYLNQQPAMQVEQRVKKTQQLKTTNGWEPIWANKGLPETAPKLQAVYDSYSLDPKELAALEQILALPDTQVVLVEFPAHPSVLEQYLDPETEYSAFVEAVSSLADRAHILFWPTLEGAILPENSWYDLFHMNSSGATAFSEWLGEQVAQAVNDGRLKF